ncbi:low molecular weight phosphotyrosine protein phosphatase [Roseospira marina]|uniref:protein-tyrosine-phosphatase n=1 Tax=Roseospira marina TaxID=140057 RepID=A0A5M6I915_9PROT|nr:low molecular weight protein-tyrosine-phosphatase [Roseospira marina]KAA5604746.1 low molecular weight phosphotyrosine protein phosphatase [Roseospira marina]MBB4313422.1 protein-tyrosine phosphatase [Roseospira marina]MBB5086584.1 protein-tyrosine phosphatase [Roseospira marina]
MVAVLFVCTGNICRSPTAEGLFRHKVADAGLASAVTVDSAGTAAFHVGEPPDERAAEAARRRGYDLDGQTARQVSARDFHRFDLLVAMDRTHFQRLRALAPDEAARDRVVMMSAFSSGPDGPSDVPDPYYGGGGGFERVLDMLEDATDGLLKHLRDHHLNAIS